MTYDIHWPYVLSVGNIEPRKNFVRLVKAYEILRETSVIKHKLIIVGGGKNSSVELAKSRSPYSTDIYLLGYVRDSDMAAIYSMAEAFIFPSIHEGFGVPILEAFACETAVVASGTSALPEVAGNAALFIDPLNPASIADGIKKILIDTDLRRSLVELGKHRLKLYFPDYLSQQICDVYESLSR
jgi:glycosyltransferase involved in cell wall biosynthesis